MNRKIILLSSVFAVLLSLVLFKTLNNHETKIEHPPSPSYEDLSRTASIEISSGDKKIKLYLEDSKWKVENRFGFNADFKKISSLIKKLESAEVIHSYDRTEKFIEEFGLGRNSKNTDQTSLTLKDQNGTPLFQILFGKQRKKGGTYFLIPGNEKIYLAKNEVDIDTDPTNWVLKELLDIKDQKIVKAAVFDSRSNKILEIKRSDKNFEPVFPKNMKSFDTSKIKDFFSFPENLSFSEIEEEKKNRKEEYRFEFTLENKGEIIISVVNRKKRLISVKTEDTLESEINFSRKMENYIFEISEFDFKRLLFSPEDLLPGN
jgi:hypothetical protein